MITNKKKKIESRMKKNQVTNLHVNKTKKLEQIHTHTYHTFKLNKR